MMQVSLGNGWKKKRKKNGIFFSWQGNFTTISATSVEGIRQYKKNSFQKKKKRKTVFNQYISIKQATAILSNAFCSTGTTLLALVLHDAGAYGGDTQTCCMLEFKWTIKLRSVASMAYIIHEAVWDSVCLSSLPTSPQVVSNHFFPIPK